jgi:hypothetical protein
MQHLDPDERMAINTLHGAAREDALDHLRIQLFEIEGIVFGLDPPAPNPAALTVQQQQVLDQATQQLNEANDPRINALLNQLYNEDLDEQTSTQAIARIAELCAQHLGPQLGEQLLQLLTQLNGQHDVDFTQLIARNLSLEHTLDFTRDFVKSLVFQNFQLLFAQGDEQNHESDEDEGEDAAAEEADNKVTATEPDDSWEYHENWEYNNVWRLDANSNGGGDDLSIDEEATAHDDLLTNNHSDTSLPDLLHPIEDTGVALIPAQPTRLHHQHDNHTNPENEHSSPITQPQLNTPADIFAPGDASDTHPDAGLEADVRQLWGPPGGWPRSDDDEL